ncbi:MAG: Veg protein [Firmicutes bacterium]|nr:Veg protein [Bacillota bacterium]
MAAKNVLDRIKEDMESFVGKRVRLKANQGRKKVIEVEGILERTYPKVFIVRLNEKPGAEKRVSFTYADVLTETVELSVYSKDKEKRIGCAGL